MVKEVKQPSLDIQALCNALIEKEKDKVVFGGKTVSIGWLTKGTIRKFSSIMIHEKDAWKRSVKCVAVILLNNAWKLRFFYNIYWRWLYYIKDLDEVEILKVMDIAKKKVPQDAFYLNTTLQVAMMDTMMMMAKHEQSPIQAEPAGVLPTP